MAATSILADVGGVRRSFRNGAFFAAVIAAFTAADRAGAQMVDYGSLQDLFGEPVTTSGNGSPQLARDTSLPMDIVTQEQIQRSGATTIPDVLDKYVGVDVWRTSPTNASVGIRGNNRNLSNRLLVLVNGRQVFQNNFNYTEWNNLTIQMDEIHQIEIVRGPNAALFGFNAVGGVVNIVTFNPLFDETRTAKLRFGTQGYVEGSVVASAKIGDRGGVRLSAGARRNDGFNQALVDLAPADGSLSQQRSRTASFNDDERDIAVNLDSAFSLGAQTQVRIEAGVNESKAVGVGVPGSFFVTDYENVYGKGEIVTETDIGQITLNGYYNFASIKSDDSTRQSEIETAERLLQLRAQNLFNIGDNVVRAGLEFRQSSANASAEVLPDRSTPVDNGRIGYRVFTADAMVNRRVTDWADATLAARVDHVRFRRSDDTLSGVFPATSQDAVDGDNRTEYSFNASVLFRPSDGDRVRLIASRGTSLPSLVEIGSTAGQALANLTTSGDTTTPTTDTWNFEANYTRKVGAIGGVLGAGVYYQINQDFRDTDNVTSGNANFVDVGDNRILGFEFDAKGETSIDAIDALFDWRANYSLSFVTDDLDRAVTSSTAGTNEALGAGNENQTPKHRVNLGVGLERGGFETELYLDYTSRYEVEDVDQGITSVAGAVVVGGAVGYRAFDDVLRLQLAADQLNVPSMNRGPGGEIDRRVYGTIAVNF